MFCRKCGNEIKDSQQFCGKCGKSVNDTNKFIINSNLFKKKSFIIICCTLIVFIGIFFGVNTIGKHNLEKSLLNDWSRVETGDSGTLYQLQLDFSSDKIEYKFISSYSWLNTTISTYDYKVVSPNKIKVKDKIYKIDFNDKKTMMTITPALTSTDNEESWYNHN